MYQGCVLTLEVKMPKQHVAIYLPSLRGGGAERVMATLANAFVARGFVVDLVLASAEGPYLKELSPKVTVVDLKAGRVTRSLPGLVAYLRRERPQAMLSALNHANVIAVLARFLARVPTRLVISERNTLTKDATRNQGIAARFVYVLMRWLYPHADGIVAVSEGAADALSCFANIPRKRIATVYNPYDLLTIQQRASIALDHPWFASGEPPVVLGIGRLTAQKDFPSLIRAFAQLGTQHPARLMILGEGELHADLQALGDSLGLGAHNFCLQGFVDNPFAYMARCGVFVLSSRWEGLPNVLIQALACGASVVSTDCPSGPAEILENGKWGTLVPVGDVEALAKAILENLTETEHQDVSIRAAYFNVERAADEFLRQLLPRNN
jgi:glycosyltransferase involved in cell wall biosynthesis